MRPVKGILWFFVVCLLFACEDNSVPLKTQHQTTVINNTQELNHPKEPPAPDPETELLKKTNRVKRVNDRTLTVELNSGEVIKIV